MKRLAMLGLLAAFLHSSPALALAQLGRLFFTPEQRHELDRRRTANVQEATPVIQDSTLTVEGYVSRSSGRTTTWINGVPHYDTQHGSDPTRVRIKAGENEPEVELKVGQTLDRLKQETSDALGNGRIVIEPVPAAR